MNFVGNGVQQVGFAKAGLAVDKQGIIALSGMGGHLQGGCVGKLVGRTHHKPVEGILFAAREEVVFFVSLILL